MSTFEPAVRVWNNNSGQRRTSVHARDITTLKHLDDNGMPAIRLEWYEDELWLVDSANLLVNADAPGLAAIGIHGCEARGISANVDAARAGNFSPGSPVDLVPEPEGANDPQAVGFQAPGGRIAGYLDKKTAVAIGPDLDEGRPLVAICLRGTPAGEDAEQITVLIASPALMTHLERRLGGGGTGASTVG